MSKPPKIQPKRIRKRLSASSSKTSQGKKKDTRRLDESSGHGGVRPKPKER